MPSGKNARKTEAELPTGHQSWAEGTIRGADALVRLVNGGASRAARPATVSPNGVSTRDRKNAKRATRLVRQADEALSTRSFKAAEMLLDEAISLLDSPPPSLWCQRLIVAARAADHEYVVNNYARIRAIASSEEEVVAVDQAWVDCLIAAGFLQEALEVAERQSARNTKAWASIKAVIGLIHGRLGDLDKAIAIQKSILEVEPSHALARWNLSNHQLEAGDLPAAFDNYEARWDWPDFPSERRTFDIPRWKGDSLNEKRILVWREQGVGDEIRFAGILPDLIATGAQVTFECGPKLVALFRKSFLDIEVRPEQPAAKRRPQDYRDFDFEVPVGSLARHFRPTAAEMQAKCKPWLKRDAEIERQVRADMDVAPQQPVIGICWRSTLQNLHRNRHFLKAEYLAPLKLLGSSKFICLQYDECRAELESLRELGLPIYDFPNIDQMNDLVSASYLIGACDVVVAAGTAVGELSAGLGVPTVLVGQKQSHIRLGTEGVPWHPASRFVPLDADNPIGVVKSILSDWNEIASWADKMSTSGRQIDWQLSFPGVI